MATDTTRPANTGGIDIPASTVAEQSTRRAAASERPKGAPAKGRSARRAAPGIG